jgi:Leucine-rich repeat (LRR) protein
LANLHNLTWIEAEDNHISDISPIAELKELTMLDLSHNNIQSLEVMKTHYRLKWLLFGDNLASQENLKAFSQRYAETCVILATQLELGKPNTAAEVNQRSYAGNPEPCAEGPK